MTTQQNDTKNESKDRLRLLFLFLGSLPFLGVLMLFVVSLHFVEASKCLSTIYFESIGYGLLIGGAAYIAGGFVGFLFGLPRYLSNPDAPKHSYSRNDNLMQISDWLTKIIVGLGLTNLYYIPKQMDQFGVYASVFFGGKSLGAATAESILVYFLVSGFLLGYLWTNLYYIPILAYMDEVTNNIPKEMQARESAANAVLDELTESINSSDPNLLTKIQNAETNNGSRNKILSFSDFTSRLEKAKQKMESGLLAQKTLPENQKDPNKNQWGGKSENNNRKITASVSALDDSDLFKVVLTVVSTSLDNLMNDGDVVLFSLHNTFNDPYKIVLVKNGIAKLELISYGAFTVGVICEDGVTELEYDLSTLQNAPKKFIEN